MMDRGKARRDELVGWLLGGSCLAAMIVLLAGVGFVVFHFVAKFW
jgi:hypothetical protein